MIESRGNVIPAKEDIPAGCKLFTVVGPTIKDSTDTYCKAGEWAVLNRKLAKHYLDLNMIRVELPEDFDDDKSGEQTAAVTSTDQA